MADLEDMVERCWRDGHLYGAQPAMATHTLTVNGKRRYRLRLQSDICRAILTPDTGPPFYPDLWPRIVELVDQLRKRAAS